MAKHSENAYDVIIVGAGIGGLVCGCYLARAGLKVLIAEQHYKPGGYCTSFKRKGFTFDAAAHSFGGYRYGVLGRVFNDLKIEKKMKFTRFDPSDIVITPDYRISFWTDLDKTIKDFQKAFPDKGTNINNFFSSILSPDPNSFSRRRSWTFKDLLDHFFDDDKLKAILSFPLLGNGGLPPSQMSALLGAQIFRQFILDGGYYPESGMQALPDTLTEIFKEYKGEILFSRPIKQIRVKERKAAGVVLDDGDFIPAQYVVSNCDARQTFLKLLGKEALTHEFLDTINNMIPSLSMFILYLGIDKSINLSPPGSNVWFLPHYDLDKAYLSAQSGDFKSIAGYMVRTSPDKKAVLAFMNTSFKSKHYWTVNKIKWSEAFIRKLEVELFPGLSNHILYKEAATPYTLYRYTLNYKGAAYGWAGMPSQLAISDFRKPSFIQGLYLTGHWTTQGLGIPGVFYAGLDAAQMILRKETYIAKDCNFG